MHFAAEPVMRRIFSSIALLSISAVAIGCTVGFDTGDPSQFPCDENADCITPYICLDDGVCGDPPDDGEPPPCEQDSDPEGDIDLDNDGYGTGDNRRNCPDDKRARDCDDTNPNINPGEVERCDGIDNNCNADDGVSEADEFSCSTSADCPSFTATADLSFLDRSCDAGTCTYRPIVRPSGSVCEQIFITCDLDAPALTYTVDGQTKTVAETPEECR